MLARQASLWSELSRFVFGGEPAVNSASRCVCVGDYEFIYLCEGLAAGLVRKDFAKLLEDPLRQIIEISRDTESESREGLGGRGSVATLTLDSEQSITIRRYLRGGAARNFSEDSFLYAPWRSLSSSRPFLELLALSVLGQQQVSAVRPVAAVAQRSDSGFSYSAALATETVKESKSLFALAAEAGDRFTAGSHAAGMEAAKMLRAGIYHPDLHPGNVLVLEDGVVVLLDFDKAQFIEPHLDFERGSQRLARRWARAIEKHQLAHSSSTQFAAGLRSGGIVDV